MGEGQPTPEQLLEEFRRFKVSDLLVSTFLTLSQLAYAKLDPAARDLEQARLAIDTMRALAPVLEAAVPAEQKRDFDQVVTNLQLAYATSVSDTSGGQAPGPGETGQETPETSRDATADPAAPSSKPDTAGGQAPGPGSEGDGGS